MSCEELKDRLEKDLKRFEDLRDEISLKTIQKFDAKYYPEERARIQREIDQLRKEQEKVGRFVAGTLLRIKERKNCRLQIVVDE